MTTMRNKIHLLPEVLLYAWLALFAVALFGCAESVPIDEVGTAISKHAVPSTALNREIWLVGFQKADGTVVEVKCTSYALYTTIQIGKVYKFQPYSGLYGRFIEQATEEAELR